MLLLLDAAIKLVSQFLLDMPLVVGGHYYNNNKNKQQLAHDTGYTAAAAAALSFYRSLGLCHCLLLHAQLSGQSCYVVLICCK